jgi:hypothetical protein
MLLKIIFVESIKNKNIIFIGFTGFTGFIDFIDFY